MLVSIRELSLEPKILEPELNEVSLDEPDKLEPLLLVVEDSELGGTELEPSDKSLEEPND